MYILVLIIVIICSKWPVKLKKWHCIFHEKYPTLAIEEMIHIVISFLSLSSSQVINKRNLQFFSSFLFFSFHCSPIKPAANNLQPGETIDMLNMHATHFQSHRVPTINHLDQYMRANNIAYGVNVGQPMIPKYRRKKPHLELKKYQNYTCKLSSSI